jgi:hypothetical protein
MDQFSVFTRCHDHIHKRIPDHFGPSIKAKYEFTTGRTLIEEIQAGCRLVRVLQGPDSDKVHADGDDIDAQRGQQ